MEHWKSSFDDDGIRSPSPHTYATDENPEQVGFSQLSPGYGIRHTYLPAERSYLNVDISGSATRLSQKPGQNLTQSLARQHISPGNIAFCPQVGRSFSTLFMDDLNASFNRRKLSTTKENKSISSSTLLETPMLSNSSSRMDALVLKYTPSGRLTLPDSAVSFIIPLDLQLQAISALFGFQNKIALAPRPPSIPPPISMGPDNTSDMTTADDPEGFEGRANPHVLKLLKTKREECEELKAAAKEDKLIRWSLEKQLDQKAHDLALALQTSESRYADCMRLDGRLHDLSGLEDKLESAQSEINSLKRSVAESEREAQFREEAFEAEKLSWSVERERLQTRISTLADSLKHARRSTLTESIPTRSPSPRTEITFPSPPQIPPEIKKELSELRELVPAYVETLDMMEFTIENLNVELEDLHQAYSDVVDKSYAQQELIEQLNQQALETEHAEPHGNLAAEISHVSPKRPSTSSAEGQTKLLKLRRLNDTTKSGEVDDLRQTNQKLNDYLERLLNRIIGLEAFEHVLNVDFEAIRNGHSRQPVVIQAPSKRARRTVSSSLAARALGQLKSAKSKFLDKLNNSASAGVQVLAKPFANKKDDHFTNFTMLLPRTRSQLGSVEYPPTSGGKINRAK
ncbi:hypothetical protein PtA15_3A362 [Puccinia triticina]|uniref:Up-regulated during septation protein 1 domain-containing protein n=1 Tax=Puccinia triticina TaxID=208348 RepID=A0ABY7CCQ2_9BASI|nr:uncharacterized protein PtA15_3A362 [Puccinia triticina]WAQ82996.1 hypothetical protein PtA15_3A362 [Puccinia triticina]